MDLTKEFIYSSAINILVVIFSILELSSSEKQRLQNDIAQLAVALPGCYSNARQYYAYATAKAKTSAHRKKNNLLLIRAEFYRFESDLFDDSLTIYFQDFTKSSKIPFSSGFYSFTPEHRTKTIRMTVYTFKKAVPGLRVSFSNYSIPKGSSAERQLASAFHKRKLKTHPSCDMIWRKTDVRTFTGVTRSDCLANLGQDKVRISVSMTLAGSRITLTEGWYSIDDRARLRELKIPYVLKRNSQHPSKTAVIHQTSRAINVTKQNIKFPSFKTNHNLSSYHRLPLLKAKSKIIRENLRTYHHKLKSLKMKLLNKLNISGKNKNPVDSGEKENGKRRRIKTNHRRQKHRVLRKYRHVKSHLLAGQRVFYNVDLSRCQKAAQVPVERWNFGGEIKNFQIIRELRDGKRKTKIYFTTLRTSMSARGAETIRREMTLHRGGHVEVKVTKQSQGSGRLERQYTFQCRLYVNKKRRGSVKMFTDNSSSPREAKSLSWITRSLDHGHDLWLIADVTKCQGRQGQTTVVVGGSLSDYDMVNDKKTLELFLPSAMPDPGSAQKGLMNGFLVKIFSNNDVILTWVNASNENSAFHPNSDFSPAYRCTLSNRLFSKSNEAGAGSVNVFIR